MGFNYIIIIICGFGCFAALGYAFTNLFLLSKYSTYEERAVQALGKELGQIHVYIDPKKLFHISIMVTVLFFLIGFSLGGGDLLTGLIFGAGLGACGYVSPRIIIFYLLQKRLEKLNKELPATLDLLSSSLRAGLSLHQAILRNQSNFPPVIAQEFGIIAHECRLGRSLAEALNHWSERITLLDVKIIVIASEISLKRGGNLSETYDTLAQLIREKFVFQKEIATLTSEGRMQALVMTALPFVMLIIMTLIKREMMMDFMKSTIGMFSIGLVVVMQVAAYLWIKKIVTIEP
jgi:tight adherence protein B